MQINSEMERILLEQQSATQSSVSSSNTSTAFSSLLNNELTTAEDSVNASVSALADLQSKATTNSLFTPADIAASQTDEDVEVVAASGAMGKVGGAKAGGASDDEDDDEDEYSELDLLEGLTDTMDELETYVSSVQNTTTLKEAWASLDAMTQSVEEMQEEYANQTRQNPEANNQMGAMGSLLNELEVMTVTETYKFNRGDYL